MSDAVLDVVLVFSAVFALDFVWCQYIASVAARRPVESAVWSVGTIVLSGAAAVKYVANPWLLIPAGLAAFAATWIAVTRDRNRREYELARRDSE